MAKSALQAPFAVPAKALNYAQYDAVQLFNELMDRVGIRRSQVERLINWALAVPVSHFLCMKRGISFPILDRQGEGIGEIGWGTYQSPILVQWRGGAPRVQHRPSMSRWYASCSTAIRVPPPQRESSRR